MFGQLLENPNTLDSRIIGHACKTLDLSMLGTVDIPLRNATRTEYRKKIFKHLSFLRFDKSRSLLHDWLKQKVGAGTIICEQLVPEAGAFLVSQKITLPTMYYLKREINSVCTHQQDILFNNVYQQLPQALIESIDSVLESDPGEHTSLFQTFKEYPGSASISMLQIYLERHKRITEIDLCSIDLSSISPEFASYLYQLGRYYDVYKIKRFRPAKRYTLMTIFLHESQKVMMDYLIQLHDQYISNICRECKNNHMKALKLYKRRNEKAIDKIEHVID